MKNRSNKPNEDLRARILGLGEFSVHKSYYPQLQEKLAEQRLFFDTANDAIFIHDADTFAIVDVNRRTCEMFGYTQEEILRMSVGQLSANTTPYTDVEAGEWLSKVKSGVPQNFEWLSRHRSGRLFWVDLSMSYTPSGRRPRIFVVARDISERKRAEEILRQSEKLTAIGQLAGGIAHDFNNQLGAIMGYADLLKHQLQGETAGYLPSTVRREWAEFVQRIVTAAQRSADLTRNLLAFSRKGQSESSCVDLGQIIEESVAILERSIDKRIVIERNFTAMAAIVRGDSSQLQNAILNLGLNARDAMPEGGTLRIELSRMQLQTDSLGSLPYVVPAGEYLMVRIQDSGCGMSKELQARIFEPFFTTKPFGKGTGLGLAAVYGTVRHHNGAITVQSIPDQGSDFRLYLPAITTKIAEEKTSPPLVPSGHAGRRVLVVEDEILLRDLAVTILKGAGHEVLTAMNGTEAIELFRQKWHEVDVVLLDVVMPGMNGPQLFRAMREIHSEVVVIITSGYRFDEEIQTLLQEGARSFLKKPYYPNELLHLVDDVTLPRSKAKS